MGETRSTVGVIGLGAMGGPVARRLLDGGWQVVVYDTIRVAVDAVVTAGARPAGSPAEVAAAARLVITSLPGEGEVRDVLLGDKGIVHGASEGTVAIDMSTLRPEAARVLEAELRHRGVGYVDAPVSGGQEAAAEGSLVIMVGGAVEVLRQASDVLEVLGSVFHCGGPGSGQVCKACNQLVVLGTIELVAEALVLAAAVGLDATVVRSALMRGYAASRVLELHGARMLGRDFAPGGKARFNLKDIDSVRALAGAKGVRLPGFEAAAQQVQRLVDKGGGDLDNSALITLLEGSSDVKA